MQSRARVVTSTAFACLGMLAGAAAGHVTRTDAPSPERRSAGAPESGFYLHLEPARIARDGAGERLTLATRVGTTRDLGTRAIASVQVEDDRGAIVQPAKVTPRLAVGARSELAGGDVALAPLADGFYRVRGHAVFVDPQRTTEALGSETDSLYLEVRDGELSIIDMSDWFARSNVNLGRDLP